MEILVMPDLRPYRAAVRPPTTPLTIALGAVPPFPQLDSASVRMLSGWPDLKLKLRKRESSCLSWEILQFDLRR
jgi:hypothetical protein